MLHRGRLESDISGHGPRCVRTALAVLVALDAAGRLHADPARCGGSLGPEVLVTAPPVALVVVGPDW
jgi:hypothetical protein